MEKVKHARTSLTLVECLHSAKPCAVILFSSAESGGNSFKQILFRARRDEISCLKDVYWILTMRLNATLRDDSAYIIQCEIFWFDNGAVEIAALKASCRYFVRITVRLSIPTYHD